MGCDIHLHTEIKVNGKWEHYGNPNVPRNYSLFAKMAGVRGEQDPIVAPRGMPIEASVITELDYERWYGDGHSHSWLNAEEISELCDWYEEYRKNIGCDFMACSSSRIFGYLFGNYWSGFFKYPEDRTPRVEDIRFVFWFDN